MRLREFLLFAGIAGQPSYFVAHATAATGTAEIRAETVDMKSDGERPDAVMTRLPKRNLITAIEAGLIADAGSLAR